LLLTDDGSGGTQVTESEAPCFLAGNRIATRRGEIAVGRLRVGDVVRVAGGGEAKVRWLGHRRLDCARHSRPQDVLPVRVGARLVAYGFVPAQVVWESGGTRSLGVAIARLELDGQTLALDDARLVSGWHPAEPAWRWTDGYATIVVGTSRELGVVLAPLGRY